MAGQLGIDRKAGMDSRIGQSGQGKSGQDSQNMAAKAEQRGRDNRKGENCGRTAMTGQSGQDIWDRITGTG